LNFLSSLISEHIHVITRAEFPADTCYKYHNLFFCVVKDFLMVSVFSTVDAFKKRQFPLNLGIINSYRTISAKQEIFMKSSQILRYMLQGTSEL